MSVLNERIPGSRSPTELDRIVGANVRRLRTERGLTLQDLAEELRISHQQLQKYETGFNRLSAGMMPVVAEALGCKLEEFFQRDDMPGERLPTPEDRLRRDCETLVKRADAEKLAVFLRVLKALSA